MSAILLYRIDSAKRMQRYYRMVVRPDLFGQWCLMREWGRSGRTRSLLFSTPAEAETTLNKQGRAKAFIGTSKPV
jgi:predicted DNA-binding WGR domain protein